MKLRKTTCRILSCFLALTILMLIPVRSSALSGETSRTTENIMLADGTDSGVTYTQIELSGYYGNGKVAHVAECDLSNTHLSIEVLNCGSNTVALQTIPKAASAFNNSDRTVLAAVNGDLWMTGASCPSSVAKSVLRATRGALVIDGEVWATQEVGQEAGIAADKHAFGVTSKNQPIVGIMDITVTMTDENSGASVKTDGLNRLPGNNAIFVYNSRLNNTNYALNDSYEIELTADSTDFRFGKPLKATVKAIYPSGSVTRPAIGANTIVVTARGSRIADVSSSFAIGDTVTFNTTVRDKLGNTDLWYDVVDAIGGHMMPLKGGEAQPFDTSTKEYPTTLIGVKPDGKVMFCTVNYKSSGAYKGLRFYQAAEFCRELGYSDVFYLDGGGSSTMVTLTDGTYTVRNATSDGSVRSVINGIAMVWNNSPVCEKQGDLGYLVEAPVVFDNPNTVNDRVDSSNCVDLEYSTVEKALKMTVNMKYNPYVRIDLSDLGIKVNQMPVAVIVYKIPLSDRYGTDTVYVKTSNEKERELQVKSVNLAPCMDGTIWAVSILDMSGNDYMKEEEATVKTIRIDPFIEGTAGAEAYIDSICFCRTPSSAVTFALDRLKERNTPSPSGTQLLLRGNLPVSSHAYEDLGVAPEYDRNDFTASFDMGFFEDGGAGCYYLCDGNKYICISSREIALGDTAALIKGSPVLTHVTPFDWGEISALNFHRITVKVRNGNAYIYSDGELKASIENEGLYGNAGGSSGQSQKLSSCTTAYVLFDNFTLSDTAGKTLMSVADFTSKSMSVLNTVSYSMNGGVGYIPKNVYVSDSSFKIPECKSKNSYYTFKGWSLNPLSAYAPYLPGQTVASKDMTTLYAVWDKKHDHVWNEGVETQAPGCETGGVITYTCMLCGATYFEETEPAGHSYGSTILQAKPDCTNEGIIAYTCLVCDHVKYFYIPALGHSFGAETVIQKPTCEKEGVSRRICTVCGYASDTSIPKLDGLLGDVNGDGQVNAIDYKQLKRYLFGYVSENIILANSDIDANGQIDMLDAKKLKMMLVS